MVVSSCGFDNNIASARNSRPNQLGLNTQAGWPADREAAMVLSPHSNNAAVPSRADSGAAMPIIAEVLDYADELTQIRRDIHAHPELGFTEERTGDLVARKLAEYGCEVHRGLAKTGVVGTIR